MAVVVSIPADLWYSYSHLAWWVQRLGAFTAPHIPPQTWLRRITSFYLFSHSSGNNTPLDVLFLGDTVPFGTITCTYRTIQTLSSYPPKRTHHLMCSRLYLDNPYEAIVSNHCWLLSLRHTGDNTPLDVQSPITHRIRTCHLQMLTTAKGNRRLHTKKSHTQKGTHFSW